MSTITAPAPVRVSASPLSFARTGAVYSDFVDFLRGVIEAHRPRQLCDLGGGANPLLEISYLRARGARCTLLDVSPTELAKAPEGYSRIVADLASPDFSSGRKFDLVFSHMLAEHVKSGEQFHRNVLGMLAVGGIAVHCFPTLYALPFLVNRIVPERAADRLLGWIQPRDRYQHAKFPAYYDWCRGPGARQQRRFEQLGYEIVEYRGLFGHPYYGKWPWLDRMQRRATARLLRQPRPFLTSYAYLVLRRPEPFRPAHP